MARASRYIPVRAIKVSLWGRTVGAIVPYSAGYCAFEYDSEFLSSGLDIAPLKMPLSNGAGPYVFNDFGQAVFMGLPGVFADSLPDGFAMSPDQIIVVTVSGRGDKDCAAIARYRGEDLHE